jgi:4-amino-4-deoxy-L-arabinose transferase-like glycosyltransferase
MKAPFTFQQLRPHWPLLILAAIALALVLTNLGRDYLWADEGDTAVLASNILKFGVPKAWDGVTFTDSDFGARVNDDLLMVSTPWVQYYIAAASFFFFGETAFAARLPFALAAAATVVLGYFLIWRVTTNRWASFCAAFLMVCSVQFLLYARQSRNYSLNMLLTCALIWLFLEMKSPRHCFVFAATAILLFHTHPIGIVAVGALGILTLTPRFAAQRQWFWFALPAILILTFPWLVLARRGYSENTSQLNSIEDFFARLTQYLIECASVTPLIGACILLLIVTLPDSFRAGQNFVKGGDRPASNNVGIASATISGSLTNSEIAFVIVIFTIVICYALAMAVTQRTVALWLFGVRYTSAVIPLLTMASGILIAKIARDRAAVWVPLLLLFAFTNFPKLTPWLFSAETVAELGHKTIAAHVPQRKIDRFFETGQMLFVRDLWTANHGTVAEACEFLQQNAGPHDIVITNYESEPMYFHTRLPQGMKIMAQDSVYEAARRKGLPQYVFGTDKARWIVWRFSWNEYLGITWADVERYLIKGGATVSLVAELKETSWENRENIHFHRFSSDTYLFPRDEKPPARIFRVD